MTASGTPLRTPRPLRGAEDPESQYARAQQASAEGRNVEALRLITSAQQSLRDDGHHLAALRMDLGRMHVLNELGRHLDAVAVGRALHQQLAAHPPPEELGWLVPATAKNTGVSLGYVGEHDEALAAYREAEAGFAALGMDQEVAALRNNIGVELLDLGRAEDALVVLRDAVDRFARDGEGLAAAESSRHVAEALVATGRLQAARLVLDRAVRDFADEGMTTQQLRTQLTVAQLDLALGLLEPARQLLEDLVEDLRDAGLAHDAAVALHTLGIVHHRRGWPQPARAALDAAADLAATVSCTPLHIDALLARARLDAAEGDLLAARDSVLHAQDLLDGGHWPAQSLRTAVERGTLALRGVEGTQSWLATCLTDALAAAGEVDDVGAHLALRRLQAQAAAAEGDREAAEAHLRAAADVAAGVGRHLPDPLTRLAFMEDKVAVHDDLVALLAEEARTVPEAVRVLEARKTTVLDQQLRAHGGAAAHLGPDGRSPQRPAPGDGAALRLAMQVHDGRLRVFTLPGQDHGAGASVAQLRHHRDAAGLEELLAGLEGQWQRQRVSPTFTRRHAPMLHATTRSLLGQLEEVVFGALELEDLAGRRVVLSPDAVLHEVPWAALGPPDSPLGTQALLSTTPGLRPGDDIDGLALADLPVSGPVVAVGVGDHNTPAVAAEVATSAEVWPDVTVLRGTRARADAVREAVAGAGLLHLAGHAVHDPVAPMRSAIRLTDGWLTGAQLSAWPLHRCVVLLSACGTARSAPLGGERLGLARAALAAGARAVLVAKWDVPDAGTARLVTRLSQDLAAGATPVAALQAAQRSAVTEGLHPYRWAAFELVHP